MTPPKENALPTANRKQGAKKIILQDDIKLCSGFGQYHTNEADPAKPNKRLTPYSEISFDEIWRMAENPQEVDKAQAQWMIPSTLPSRSSEKQESGLNYVALWCDFDKDPHPIPEIAAYWAKVSGAKALHYSSRSAKPDCQKSRLIVPVPHLFTEEWELAAECLNDLFEKAGFNPDRVTERSVQLCYLPNRGEFYEWHKHDGEEFEPLQFFSAQIRAKRQAITEEEQAAEGRLKVAEANRANFKASGDLSAVEAFNKCHTIEEVLLRAGYSRRGARFRHPHSESGGYSVSIKNGRAYSHSPNDPLYTANESNGAHDAFSAWAVLYFGGDQSSAAKAVFDGMDKPTALTIDLPKAQEPQKKEEFSLKCFSINSKVEEMKSQMLDDKFIMGEVALLGQMTVFFASPNAGKTLLTIKLLIDAIQGGNLDADNVFYINADDNHKGLVAKTELAVRYGFNMVAPGYNGFRCDSVPLYLETLVEKDACHGQIVILDTVKKFTDLMDKKANSEFNKSLRAFVAKGGSVVGLAHVNKHKNAEGKSIAAGTSDMKDDFDCAYTLECIGPDHNGFKVVTFENTKNRGANVSNVSYRYRRSDGMSYEDILQSVEVVSDEEVASTSKESLMMDSLRANREIVNAIEDCLNDGTRLKTDIIIAVAQTTLCPKQRVKKILELHTGKDYGMGHRWWQSRTGKSGIEYSVLVDFDALLEGSIGGEL